MKARIAHALTPEQLAYLEEHYPTTSNEELAKALGISINTVRSRCTRHGWRKDKEYIRKVQSESAIKHDTWKRLNIPESHAKGVETRRKLYAEDKIRIKWGLPQLTQRHFASEPREKQLQRNYLKRIGYIIDDVNLIAYYTTETHRATRLERIKRGVKKGSIKPFYEFKPLNHGE